jgi:hypothetical protein
MNVLIAAALLSMAKPIADQAPPAGGEQIRILPVSRTPESNTVSLKISMPEEGRLVDGNPVWVQFRIDGYSLGSGSQFDRASEVSVSPMGQTVHVVVDDRPYFPVNEPAIDPFNEGGWYYDTSYKFEIPFSLKNGMHTLRMFPARSYGESLKGENALHAVAFYVGSRGQNPDMDLSQPYLIYNEPGDQIRLFANRPVLLDFYIKNCELSADGYKVLLTVDGKVKRTLTSWQPYYIYGLKLGKHTVRLQLMDPDGNQVPGLFNDIQRTITVH